jgi:hypothetical protein
MSKLLFIILLVINLYSDINWNKLLHYTNETNLVVSSPFFLSDSLAHSPDDELKSMIKLLDSIDGKTIACNFPARYTYLKEHDYVIPDFDLGECKQLNTFMDSFANDKLSIVFTSEYVNSPASAFGHTMLLFTNDDEDMSLGDCVHYAAHTPKEGFFKYAYKGSTGKYTGSFIREPFFKKIYDYNTLEQRYMYVYTLDFTKQQIKYLQYHLYELRKASFKYYFMDENCASQTTDLLNVVTSNIRKDKTYYLPIDVVRDYEDKIVDKNRFTPLINKLDMLVAKMTSDELKLFENTIKSNVEVRDNYPDIVKEAMVYYSTFYFRRFHRVFKNYDSAMNQKYIKQSIVDKSLDPLDKPKPSNFEVGVYNLNSKDYLYLHYRPLFINLYNIQLDNIQQSDVDTFSWDIIVNKNNIKLNKFNIVNLKSFTKQSIFYRPTSWGLYSGFNRENNTNELKFNNEIGVGRTITFSDNLSSNILMYLGMDNIDMYLKPYVNVNYYLSNNTKIMNTTIIKQYDGDYYFENKLLLAYSLNDYQYNLETINTDSKSGNSLRFSIMYSF